MTALRVRLITQLSYFSQYKILTDDEFETIWVEIISTKAKNIICCCAYRHLSFNPERFKENLESILSQLAAQAAQAYFSRKSQRLIHERVTRCVTRC